MSATTLRVDSRLVHGQVIETWLPALGASSIVVVDEGTAENQLAQAAMRLAIPPGVTLTILAPEEAGEEILGKDRGVLVLVPTIDAAVSLVEKLNAHKNEIVVNVGVMHHSPGRRPIIPGIHLSEREIDMLFKLSAKGYAVEVRGLPNQAPLAVEDVRSRYQKSPS